MNAIRRPDNWTKVQLPPCRIPIDSHSKRTAARQRLAVAILDCEGGDVMAMRSSQRIPMRALTARPDSVTATASGRAFQALTDELERRAVG
jgi:hypothetical protein